MTEYVRETTPQENYARYDYAWQTPAWTVQNPAYIAGSPDGYYDPGLPADVSKVRIFGTPLDWETGRPLESVLTIRCTSILRYVPTGQQVMPGVRKHRFRGNEGINIVLAATDDPQLVGEPGWGYEGRLTVKGVTQEFKFSLPSTPADVSIFDLINQQSGSVVIDPAVDEDGMVLGSEPSHLTVNLITGSDFSTGITLDEAWPDGAVVRLVFDNGQVWTATVSGTSAVFNIDKTVADPIPNGHGVRLTVTTGTDDATWAIGAVVRHE